MSRHITLKPHLTAEELFQRSRACRKPNELAAALRSEAPDGGRWAAPKVAAWIEEERTGRSVHETTARRAMRRR